MSVEHADTMLLDAIADAAISAGRAALAAREAGLSIARKADDSPVTGADIAAEAAALEALARIAPSIPVVAEELVAEGRVPAASGEFFLVDALDGTKEFIKGGNDFTANIALIRDGVPVLGAVAQPAARRLYAGGPEGAWAQSGGGARQRLTVRRARPDALVAVASKSHRTPETDEFLALHRVAETVSVGSSLKFCIVAEGKADLYPRLGRTMEWDIAAGHAVLAAAGGGVRRLDGAPLDYGKRNQADDSDFANPHFVAFGDEAALAAG